MVQVIKAGESSEERDKATLVLMKPGVWYCTNNYDGCEPMPEFEDGVASRSIGSLAKKGFVESAPVFEGFIIEKHRISPKGIAWLSAH